MFSFLRFPLLAFVLFICASPAALAGEYEISLFRQYFSQFQMANQQYQSAASGSYPEQLANQQRQAAAQSAENIIRAPNTFLQISASENENLLMEFNHSYQVASSGSLEETVYDIARRAAAEGLKVNAINEIKASFDYNQALQMALNADQKYQTAASGSLLESIYEQVRTQAYSIAQQKLQSFTSYQLQDFRQSEALFLQFNQQYQVASSGSRLESFYDSGRRTLQTRSLELFRNQLFSLSYSELSSLQSEYDHKYQMAASGSLAESLYLTIRDEVRVRLSGSNPQPTPPSQYYGCEVHSGANAAGQLLYRVMTHTGAIIATVPSANEATQIANTDPRCFEN